MKKRIELVNCSKCLSFYWQKNFCYHKLKKVSPDHFCDNYKDGFIDLKIVKQHIKAASYKLKQ